MNITSIIDSKPIELPHGNVYYLPSPLTHLQRCLVEVLLKLHNSNLNKIIEQGGADDDDKQQDKLSDDDMMSLLVNNWESIESHPFLLVDHYIPKKLILMESSPNLIKDSGKFKQFDDLINKLENFKYNAIVVARTIKELDLIESYLLGRRLNYKRYTGASLYDINTYQESSSSSSSNGVNNNSNNNNNNNNNNIHRKKRTGDYVSKLSKNNPQVQFMHKNPKDKLTLHLISSNQLKTMYFNENLKFNLIISFDSMLGNLEYLRQLKNINNDGNLIPLIKLVVFNSIEHFKLLGEENLQKLVYKSIINKDQPVEFETDLKWLQDYTKCEWGIDLKTVPVKEYNKSELLNVLNAPISHNTKRPKLDLDLHLDLHLNLTEYKHTLTKLIKNDITELSDLIKIDNDKLDQFLIKDSSIQTEIETKNQQIADLVKSKQLLESELGSMVKRLEKLNSDSSKFESMTISKNEILNEVELNDDFEINETELENLNKLNDDTRSEYQLTSSKALENSMKLNIITNENAMLKNKLDDTISKQIKDQLLKINNYNEQYTIDKLTRENKFLTDYNNKINNIVRNNNIFDSTNGRSGNGRLSRSTTPRI